MQSTGTVNQTDVDLFSDLHTDNEVQTTTNLVHKPSEALIRKCLHPPSAVPEFCGLPTNDARSQVCIEWRDMEIMQNPRGINQSVLPLTVQDLTAADLATFDYAFLIPNGARVKSIGYVYNKTEGRMMQDLNGVMLEQLYNFQHWKDDVNLFRPSYKSSTFYLNATAFNDTGMVVGNQFNPNILFAGSFINLSQSNPTLFYTLVKALHTKSNIITQRPTREEVAEWERLPHYHRVELLKLVGANPTDVLKLDPNTNHQIVSFGRLSNDVGVQNVPSSSQILGNSLRSLGCKAKEGMFSVQRLNTITPSWNTGSNTFNTNTTGIGGLYQCWYAETNGAGDEYTIQPFYENANVGTDVSALNALFDTIWTKDMTWSWVRFSGLSLNSQTSVSTQLLIKKVISGYEVQPCTASAWSGMMKLAPKPDLAAMQAMMDGFYELKDVMPARYNFWGTIASMAASGLKTFGADILSGLASKLLGSSKSAKSKPKPKSNSSPNKKSHRRSDEQLSDKIADLTNRVAAMGIDNRQRGGRRHNSPVRRRNNNVPPKRKNNKRSNRK